MPGLELKQNNDTYLLDPLGTVTLNGAAGGQWMTDRDNRVVVTKPDGTTVNFEVAWAFNADNQLVVSAAGAEFNFHSVAASVPRYETRDAVLVVRPNKNESFTFELRPEWSLNEDHDLALSIGGTSSVLDGFINDPRSRFMFHFFNKKNLLQGSVLGFVGTWSEFVDADGKPRLRFAYKRDGQADGEFVLPEGAAIDRGTNQLMYEYDKQGRKQRIQFVGTLTVTNDFVISYGLDRQTSNDGQMQVTSTTFTFGAVFTKQNFTGDLELTLKKDDGTAGSTTLAIAGKFTAVLNPGTKLQAGFTFNQVRAGNNLTTTFGFAGRLVGKAGAVQWVFSTDNAATRTITLAVNSEIRLGDARLDARLNVNFEDGQVKGTTFLLGIGF